MIYWCNTEPTNDIRIIKDEKQMWTPDYIDAEKATGNAKVVIWIPRWVVCFGYSILKLLLGQNEKVYLINKAVYPLRTE